MGRALSTKAPTTLYRQTTPGTHRRKPPFSRLPHASSPNVRPAPLERDACWTERRGETAPRPRPPSLLPPHVVGGGVYCVHQGTSSISTACPSLCTSGETAEPPPPWDAIRLRGGRLCAPRSVAPSSSPSCPSPPLDPSRKGFRAIPLRPVPPHFYPLYHLSPSLPSYFSGVHELACEG